MVALIAAIIGAALFASESISVRMENVELKSKVDFLQVKISTLENENKELLLQREKLEREKNQLTNQISTLKSQLEIQREDFERERNELENEITQLNNQIDQLREQNNQLLNERNQLLEKSRDLENKIVQLNNTIAQLKEEIERLLKEKEEKEKEEEVVGILLEPPFYIIGGTVSVPGFHGFYEEFTRRMLTTSIVGGYPLVMGVEAYLAMIRNAKTVIIVIPPAILTEYEELAQKYPDLAPLPVDELEKLKDRVPFLYFTKRDDKIRGLIVADSVYNLAALLLDKGVILDVPFCYVDGEIKILSE